MPRGGMSANPVGTGNERIDRIDFSAFCSGTDSPLKMLFINVIADAASNYLFYGLGKNGTTAEEFWYATEYFMTVRSYKPNTWSHARYMKKIVVDPVTGKRKQVNYELSDEELKLSCFDRHLEIAELDKFNFTADKFAEWIEKRRLKIIDENREQMDEYIDLLQRTAIKKSKTGTQLGFSMEDLDRRRILSHPESPEELAGLIYYQNSGPKEIAKRSSLDARIKKAKKSKKPIPASNLSLISSGMVLQ